MATTYEPIATTTLGSAQSSITFTSISGSYTDLIMVYQGTADENVSLRFNSDSGSNYSWTRLRGNGSAASSSRGSNTTLMAGSYDTGLQNSIWQVFNYANSTTYKTALNRGGGATLNVDTYVGLWRSTAAITSMTVISATGNFASGSTFTLYGILAA